MTGAKQTQGGRVVEFPKAIETHGIQTLQCESLGRARFGKSWRSI
jgi:hypothetical protein